MRSCALCRFVLLMHTRPRSRFPKTGDASYDARMARIFVTRRLVGNALDHLRAAGHELDVWPGAEPPTQPELIAHATQADALLCTLSDRIDAAFLDANPQ